MSIALSALIITLLLLPGAVFIKAYTTGLQSRESVRFVPIQEILIQGLILSVIFHLLSILVILKFGYVVQLNLIYQFLLGEKKSDIATSDVVLINSFLQFSLYTVLMVLASFISAKILRRIVSKYNLDLRYPILAMSNHWFILFSARYLETPGVPGEIEDADLLYVEVLTDYKVIYSGILQDFTYSSSKDLLETVVLNGVVKKDFRIRNSDFPEGYPDEGNDGREIPCEIFSINASRIVNIAISYLNLSGPDFPETEVEI